MMIRFVSYKRMLMHIIVSSFLFLFSPTVFLLPMSQSYPTGAPINIAFLGDSLINRPCEYDHANDGTLSNQERPTNKNRNMNFGLLQKIEVGLEKFGATLDNGTRVFADDGQTIFDIVDNGIDADGNRIPSQLERLQEAVQDGYQPDVIVLFWDSDISNFVRDHNNASDETLKAFLKAYKRKLQEFATAIDALGIRLIIAGPGLLGEGWKIGLPAQFWGADPVLDACRNINRDIAMKYKSNRAYLDVRAALQEKSSEQYYYNGGVTLDGEHLNNTGTQIFANVLVIKLAKMLHLQ